MADNAAYHLELAEAPDSAPVLAPELTILYAAAGSTGLLVNAHTVKLSQYDLISIDPGSEYSLHSTQDAILCILRFSGPFLEKAMNGASGRFILNSAEQRSASYGKIRHLFMRLLTYDSSRHLSSSGEEALVLEIFSELADRFFVPDEGDIRLAPEDSSRMRLIMQYISSHLYSGCSITELSEKLYLSQPALSRFFKKKTGLLFSDYVNNLKMAEAARSIVSTDVPFSQISNELGFSGTSSFYHAFSRKYGMTPAEYRSLNHPQPDVAGGEADGMDAAGRNTTLLRERLRETIQLPEDTEVLTVRESIDIRQRRGEALDPGRLVSAGAFGSMLMVNVQHHILMLKEELGITYVRLWNPFSTRLKITDGTTAAHYNFDLVDQVLDFLVRSGLKPFIDYGTREDRALRTRSETIFIEHENVIFATKELWETALQYFIQHIILRYGEEEVSTWGFELFNTSYLSDASPLPYRGDDQFPDAYRSFHRIVKSSLPDNTRCGPGFISSYPAIGDGVTATRFSQGTAPGSDGQAEGGTAAGKHTEDGKAAEGQVPDETVSGEPTSIEQAPDRQTLDTFLRSCADSGIVPDFISIVFHCYDQKADPFSAGQEVVMLQSLKRLLSQYAMSSTRIIVPEWYSSVSSRNYLNDSCYRAVYFIRKFAEAAGIANMMSAAIASDWVSNYFDSHSVSNGGNGLLTRTAMKKPLLVALKLLFKMPPVIISKSAYHLMTCNERGTYYLLCSNFPIDKASEYELNEIIPDPADASVFIESHPGLQLTVTLRGILSEGKYSVRMESISEQEGTILSGWKQFGYESELEEYEIRYIRDSIYPRMNTRRLNVSNQSMSLTVTLPPFGAALFTIRKV
ncbi:MAG: helix-turn-helix domain-containing protein [Lachnospiraceae bacterium]|nr:helix-turn-helix domain-containing protein [Lachnospiraceae bacterium]